MSDTPGATPSDERAAPSPVELNRYARLIESLFLAHYTEGAARVEFDRAEIQPTAETLGIALPRNLGDIIYTFRYRAPLPQSVRDKAPAGKDWIIRPAGRSRYRFVAVALAWVVPTAGKAETKVPDGTPGIIERYAKSDEQALLAKLRYNRLIDVFTGVTCYSLQNHLRTTVRGMGQVETDEVYVGLDRRGVHYVFPVQAKGGSDALSVVQIEQDFALGRQHFPGVVCRPIAAQFVGDNLIALFDFEESGGEVRVASEEHYRLVPADSLTAAELASYQTRRAP